MVKTFKKSSSVEPKGRWPWNSVCVIGYSGVTKFAQMMTLGWPWPSFNSDYFIIFVYESQGLTGT